MKAGKVAWKSTAGARSPREDCLSVTATSSYYHVPVFLQDHIGIVIEIKNRDGIEFRGRAAGLGDVIGIHQMNLLPKRAHLSQQEHP